MSFRSNRYKRKNTRRPRYSRQKKITSARDVRQRGGTRVKQNKKLPIPLRVLLIMIIPMVIVHLINALLLGGFYSLASIAFIIIYFVAGFIGGNYWFEDHSRFRHGARPQAIREGAACGITLGVLNFIVLIFVVVILGLVTAGVGAILGGVSIFLCGPGDIISSLFVGGLGGWVSELTHSRR